MDKKYIQEILKSPSALLLILSNLLVLVTVFFSNISIVNLLLIYWLEFYIILFFYNLKIIIYKIFFNYAEYSYLSIFVGILIASLWFFVYLPFILLLVTPLVRISPYASLFEALFSSNLIFLGFIVSFLALFISHLISFLIYFKINPSLEETSSTSQFWGRAFVFHASILLGLFLGIFLGGLGQGVLIIFILIKTIIDLNSHLNYHK